MNHAKGAAPPLATLLAVGCTSMSACLLAACGGAPAQDTAPVCEAPTAAEDWARDLLHMDLAVDLDSATALATITVAAAESTGLSLEASGLEISAVSMDGCALDWSVGDGALHLGVPAGVEDPVVEITYGFASTTDFDGWSEDGFSLTWPYFCGNLFPCHSDPADGLSMSLSLSSELSGSVLVYPEAIPAEAPSYQLAWARGPYERLDLGRSAGGVDLEVWYLGGDRDTATRGTEHLLAAWEWLEATMGPYPFGERAGTVEVDWGPGAYGGMEHHPLVHVGSGSMGDRVTQIHEAAHGWYGGGVRIACWEDFVLSEGTVTYLTARAITEVIGAEAGEETWAEYDTALAWSEANEPWPAWPEGCGEIDILDDDLFSYAPYQRGAEFYRRYAELVGVELLDEALASFFQEHVGQAATMQSMLEHLHLACGEDPMPLAEEWLR
jgi:aminopeptidase N